MLGKILGRLGWIPLEVQSRPPLLVRRPTATLSGRGNEREPAVRSNVRFAAEAVQDFSITVSGPKNTKHKVLKPGPLPLVLDHENLYR